MKNPFNTMVERYDSWFDRYKNAYLSELYAIKKFIPKKGIGLEIGVGTGRFAARLGIKIGIDVSVPMMKLANQRGVLCIIGRSENLPFLDNSFDFILITTSICFFKNPEKALKEANRVLKDTGRLILCFVDKNSFLGKKYKAKKSAFYKNSHFFSMNDIEKMLTSANFKISSKISTINKDPSEMSSPQKPNNGLKKSNAFIVLSAIKNK